MKIDVVASLPHYLDHMLPIFGALPAELKGDVHPLREEVQPPLRSRIALVAGWQDVSPLRGRCRMIYVEHGAGQTYTGDMKTALLPGYSASGGSRHQGVIGFICPSQTVANRWRTAPAVAVGCPKMDRYLKMRPPTIPAVCFAWHWPCTLSPEAGSAWNHYLPRLPLIVDHFRQQGFSVYGHAHPRWEGHLDKQMEYVGMTVLPSDSDVFSTASILIVDNSSVGMEFMSLGRPVVWMNMPAYRRDIHHGGRFWAWTDGIPTVDTPEELETYNLWDLMHDVDNHSVRRQQIVQDVYQYTDGRSSERAADFIAQLVSDQ